jgi:hypothetical protein
VERFFASSFDDNCHENKNENARRGECIQTEIFEYLVMRGQVRGETPKTRLRRTTRLGVERRGEQVSEVMPTRREIDCSRKYEGEKECEKERAPFRTGQRDPDRDDSNNRPENPFGTGESQEKESERCENVPSCRVSERQNQSEAKRGLHHEETGEKRRFHSRHRMDRGHRVRECQRGED